MTLYNVTMELANVMNCSFDDAAVWGMCAFMVFLVLIGWAFSFFVDFGMSLYPVTKAAFRFIRRKVVNLLCRLRRL